MTEAGASVIAAAQSNGAWTMYDEIEDLVIPPDLAAENRMANHAAGRDRGPATS